MRFIVCSWCLAPGRSHLINIWRIGEGRREDTRKKDCFDAMNCSAGGGTLVF